MSRTEGIAVDIYIRVSQVITSSPTSIFLDNVQSHPEPMQSLSILVNYQWI